MTNPARPYHSTAKKSQKKRAAHRNGSAVSRKKHMAAMRKKKADLGNAKAALTVLLSATVAVADSDAADAPRAEAEGLSA